MVVGHWLSQVDITHSVGWWVWGKPSLLRTSRKMIPQHLCPVSFYLVKNTNSKKRSYLGKARPPNGHKPAQLKRKLPRKSRWRVKTLRSQLILPERSRQALTWAPPDLKIRSEPTILHSVAFIAWYSEQAPSETWTDFFFWDLLLLGMRWDIQTHFPRGTNQIWK